MAPQRPHRAVRALGATAHVRIVAIAASGHRERFRFWLIAALWSGFYCGRMSDLDGLSRDELLAALAERDQVIAVLRAEIEMLKRRAGMDSSNSSLPPGSDRPTARARRGKQRKGKPSPRRRGGQAGHEGHGLRGWPAQTEWRCWLRPAVAAAVRILTVW